MTHVQRNWFQRWLPTVAVIVALVTNMLVVGRWTARIEGRLDKVEIHAASDAVHMPWEKKIEIFMTRREAEKADNEIRELLNKIEDKIDFLYEKAQSKTP